MNRSVAIIAAHPDDEVLGCGGTIARLASEGYHVHVLFIADGESSRSVVKPNFKNYLNSARNIAAEKACNILECMSMASLNLPDNRLDSIDRLNIIKKIEEFIIMHSTIMVFTHHAGDVNIDHRIVHDSVIAATRPQPGSTVKEILFFEVPSSTEWRPPSSGEFFHPNIYVDISKTLQIKKDALKAYSSELRPFPHPRSIEAIEALAKWRGATSGVDAVSYTHLRRRRWSN